MFRAIFLSLLLSQFNQILSAQNQNMEKPKIIYVFDALCGWCYGFSPVIKEFHEHYQSEFDFEIISGGLIVGSRIGPYGDFATYIINAIPGLEQTTGVTVGEAYKQQLVSDHLIQNSIPPAKALCYVKSLLPEKAFKFAHDLQLAKFYEGKDLNDVESYKDLISDAGLSYEAFSEYFENNDDKAYKEFEKAAAYGVSGYPAVILKINDKTINLSRGYVNYKQLEEQLKRYYKK